MVRFGLIHSPLVGPDTWAPVAVELERRGHIALVPAITGAGWREHVRAAAAALGERLAGRDVVLAGHSGAGPLLPAIGQALGRPVAGYVFVDAGLPHGGQSRLEAMRAEGGPFAADLERMLARGGRYPTWAEADLAELVPDARRRAQLVAGLQPRGADYFTEPLPDVPAPARCAYVLFSPAYAVHAERARALGWPVAHVPGGHFHMLVEPRVVARAISALIESFSRQSMETG